MKKLASLILIIVYFTFSAGATMHLHYCSGEYAGFTFINTSKENSCSKCRMNNHTIQSNCCNDIIITAKISDPHGNAYPINVREISVLNLGSDFPEINTSGVANTQLLVFVQKQPPDNWQSFLYLFHKNFRI